MLMPGIAGGLAAAVASWAFTALLIQVFKSRGVVDIPNERSSHTRPTPRGGGLGILAGLAAGVALQALSSGAPVVNPFFVTALIGIAVTGFADDLFGIPALIRLAFQGTCAALLLSSGCAMTRLPVPHPIDLPLGNVAGWGLSWLWLVGMTNIYNFLDGIDGFAALQGCVACVALSVGLMSTAIAPVCAALAGACAGFLLHNWHPARIFMGDVGSTAIGFLIAAAPLQAREDFRPTAVLMAALAVWFFVSDGMYTMTRRALRGERIWTAHRSHLYQRYVAAGFRHDHVVIRVMSAAVALAAAATAAALSDRSTWMWAVLACAAASFLIYRGKVEAVAR